jgi:hypothetical protein
MASKSHGAGDKLKEAFDGRRYVVYQTLVQ